MSEIKEMNVIEEVKTKKESKIKGLVSKSINTVKEHPVKTALGIAGVVGSGVLVYFGVKKIGSGNPAEGLKVMDFDDLTSLEEMVSDVIEA